MNTLCFSALLLLLPAVAGAESEKTGSGEYVVDFWQEDSGLPQTFVNTLHQTADGYLWIGTRGGLARFDGVGFKVFDDRDPRQLRESEVIALSGAPDGSLWIGTHEGGLSHLKDGTFTTFTTKDGLPSNLVAGLAAAPDGTVWIGTGKGLARLSDGHIVAASSNGAPLTERVTSLYLDNKGVLWIGTTHGLGSYTDGRLSMIDSSKFRIMNITGDGRGTIWAAAYSDGLLRVQDGTVTHFGDAEGLTATVSAVAVDGRGAAWVGSADGIYRQRGDRFEKVVSEIGKKSGNRVLQTASLRGTQALIVDREGSVWAGTAMDGVARVREAAFRNVSGGKLEDGTEERVSSLFEDHRGAIWMSVGNAGVARLQDGVMTRFDLPQKEKVSVDSLFEDHDGTVWAANENGLFRSKGRAFELGVGDLPDIAAVTVGTDGTVWLGAKSNGLFRYVGGKTTRYGKKEGLGGVMVRALALDFRGRLWVGTKDGGLSVLENGVFTTYSEAEGLPSPAVAAVYADPDGVIWVATRRGLSRIREGKLATFTSQQGLPANYFYQIVEDDLAHLWMTFGRGIARVSKQELNDVAEGRAKTVACRTFGIESGMRNTSMIVPNQPSAWKAHDGRVWFATGRGAVVVDPAALTRNEVVPPAWVEEIRVDRSAHLPKEGLVFPPGDGDIEVQYTGLSFLAPERMRFQYRLDGADDRWIDAGTRRVAYYTTLPPGAYRFRVKACNNDGVWNEVGHSVGFRLLPHWYQTRWFAALVFVLTGLTLAGAYKWRVREHHRREKDLARRVDEALLHVKTLRGLLPICAGCKKIRDDGGYWNQMETYIQDHSEVDFSHGMCPDCITRLYPEYAEEVRRQPK